MKRLFMETTEIPATKTAGEIVSLLVAAGATQINQLFTDRRIAGISFCIVVKDREWAYTLPARVEPVRSFSSSTDGEATRAITLTPTGRKPSAWRGDKSFGGFRRR